MAFSLLGLLAVVHEFFLNYLWLIVPIMVTDAVLLLLYFKRIFDGGNLRFKQPLIGVMLVGVFVFCVSIITLPHNTKSSWPMLSGIDYVLLLGSGVGFGVLWAIASIPLMLNFLGFQPCRRESSIQRVTPVHDAGTGADSMDHRHPSDRPCKASSNT